MEAVSLLQPLDIHALLRRYHLRPKKGLGQHFMVDPGALKRVAAASELSSKDQVLEVGPGLGSLTRYLAVLARQVLTVELDPNLIPPLEEVLAPFSNVHILQGDIMEIDPAHYFEGGSYQVVANIPYYITSALIRHLLGSKVQPSRLVLTVQQAVAERICAEPGRLSLLALSVQVFGRPQIKGKIPAGAFYPRPKVDSSIVRVDIYPQPLIPVSDQPTFFQLARAGFSQKRKTLRNALAGGMRWQAVDAEAFLRAGKVDPRRRAQSLSIEEWKQLTGIAVQQLGSGEDR